MTGSVRRARWTLTMLLWFVAACGSPAAPAAPGSGAAQPSGAGGPASVGPASPEPAPPGETTAPPASGATIRLVNVWAEPDGAGQAVELRVRGDDDAAPLLEVAPGAVSEFVDVPRAQFGDRLANLVIVPAGGPSTQGTGVGELQPGDRVTAIVHGEARDGLIAMRVEPVWETGEPFYGLPWPDVGADKATLAVYSGPLLIFERASMTLRTAEGSCFVETTFGEPQESGFGGTGARFFVLEPGTTNVHAAMGAASGCAPVEPDIGEVVIDAEAGDRLGLIPWGSSGQLQLLLLEMGA